MIRGIATVTGLGVGIGAGVAGWSLWEARSFQRSFHHLNILPNGMEPMRILNISDIHLMPGDEKKVEFLRDLADLKPDAVFLTGDQLSSTKSLPSLLRALQPLNGIPGAFVFGSHDYHAPVWKNPLSYVLPFFGGPEKDPEDLPHAAMAEAFRDFGWTDMRNTRSSIQVNNQKIQLVGVDDPHIDLDEYPAPKEQEGFTIGLTHAPYTRVLNAMEADSVTLALAGHTHGGQVCVPGYGALITNCDLDTAHVAGVFGWPAIAQEKTMTVAISRGLGTSPYAPFRLACRPEVQIIDLA